MKRSRSVELARLWGENLRRQRTAVGFKQGEIAEAVGVSQSTISQWERGETMPVPEHQVKVAALLRSDPRILFPLVAAEGVA